MPNVTRLAAQASLAILKRLLVRLSPGDRSWLARHVVQDRAAPSVRALVDFGYGTIRGWKNSEFDIEINGEAMLMQRLRPFSPRTVLDVGANIGDWSIAALQYLPDATVHAFEIAPATSAKLIANAAGAGDRLIVNACGLGDTTGQIMLYYTPESDTASSTVSLAMDIARPNHGVTRIEEMTVPITTGDAYMAEHGLTHIDFLKIDVEGAELSVLNGFAGAFARKAIDLVQFEYGQVNLRTRVFLEDFCKFFTAHGFVVGKLLPQGVGFKSFELADEDFIGLNFIACRAERGDLVAAIGCPALSLN
jgi:FkbM family methyltransferase